MPLILSVEVFEEELVDRLKLKKEDFVEAELVLDNATFAGELLLDSIEFDLEKTILPQISTNYHNLILNKF